MEPTFASMIEIRDAIRGRKISAEEVCRHFLDRSQALNGRLNAYVSFNEKALDEARSVDRALSAGQDLGPLAGLPIAIKDLLCTEGVRTTAASKILHNFVPPYSATVVQRLKSAGAIILGKTNLDEFAMGSSNETSATGVCRNPWNTDYVPGGSSGGSAAVLAARMVPGSIGTDTGGSIRQPAAFCGVYGIKPTYGRVSRYGIIAYASSLDQAGPMANTTRDCALMLETIAGQDGWDQTTSDRPVPAWSQEINDDVGGLRVGLPKEYFGESLDPEVEATVRAAVKRLEDRGAKVIEVSLPLSRYSIPVYYLIATSEASSNLARYDGVRYGHRADFSKNPASDVDELYSLSRGQGFGTEVKRRIMLGTYALSSGYYDAYYLKASQVRRLVRDEFLKAFSLCDVLLSPVAPTPAFKIGERIDDPLQMYLNDILTTSTNLAGLPGMSVPGGLSANGLPIGIQLIGRHFDEQTIFNFAQALETSLPKEERKPHVI